MIIDIKGEGHNAVSGIQSLFTLKELDSHLSMDKVSKIIWMYDAVFRCQKSYYRVRTS